MSVYAGIVHVVIEGLVDHKEVSLSTQSSILYLRRTLGVEPFIVPGHCICLVEAIHSEFYVQTNEILLRIISSCS